MYTWICKLWLISDSHHIHHICTYCLVYAPYKYLGLYTCAHTHTHTQCMRAHNTLTHLHLCSHSSPCLLVLLHFHTCTHSLISPSCISAPTLNTRMPLCLHITHGKATLSICLTIASLLGQPWFKKVCFITPLHDYVIQKVPLVSKPFSFNSTQNWLPRAH